MDILNISPINQKHQHFLTNNYINSSKEIQLKEIKITVKEKIEECYKSGVMSVSTIVLLFIAIFSYETIDIGVFASLMALASLYGRMLNSLTHEISSIQSLIDSSSDKKSYDKIIQIIADKYLELTKEQYETSTKIDNVNLINLDFVHEDIQSKVLHRIIADEIKFESGGCTLIYGESGSGKSTLLKILAGIYNYDDGGVVINNEIHRNSIYNYVMYEPDSTFGSKSILEEVTLDCNKSNVDKQKFIDILKGLSSYETVITKAKHEPILEYLSSVFKDTFSAGQIQRFILARLLYNMESNIDVVILDEPIANLDDDTACKVIEFIDKFCNTDLKRIVLIASHQVKIVEKYCKVKYNFSRSDENYFRIEAI
jgi:ABC-type bacteriocin/lantibiotic exporter with double-glycine peptidase domain